MKVLLYFENQKVMKQSGIGRALSHQKKALELAGVDYTLNKKEDFDVAHINTLFFASHKVLKKCKKKNKKVIVHGHSTVEDFYNSFRHWKLIAPFYNRLILRMYRKADYIITPTPYSKRLIEGYKGVKCPVVAVSNGIDLQRYTSVTVTPEDNISLRKQFNIGENDKIVMGIGFLFQRKGVHDFIEIAKRMPDVKFIWFGKGSYFINTKSVAKALKKKPSNLILPGYVPQEVIIKMLKMSNCFFFPSYEETEGIVLLEALATKTPVLIRDIGVFDYLTDGVDCYKASNNDGFIEKLNYIINNDNQEVINNGYKIAEERTLDIIGEELNKHYNIVLNNK